MTRSSPPNDAPPDVAPASGASAPEPDATRDSLSSAEEGDLSAILRETMANTPAPVDVLPGVQQKLRERSGGKFYRDRWSTDRHPPIPTYLVTSALMLVVVTVAYLILRPLSGIATQAPTPAPVQIVGPAHSR